MSRKKEALVTGATSQSEPPSDGEFVYVVRKKPLVPELWSGFRFRKELFDLEEDFFIRPSAVSDVLLDHLPSKLQGDPRISVRRRRLKEGEAVVRVPPSLRRE